MNSCTEFMIDKTKFLVVRSLKNVIEAHRFCLNKGYRLAVLEENIVQQLFKSIKNCSIATEIFIVDQVKDDEKQNKNCYVIYEEDFEFGYFQKSLNCDHTSEFSFICSKFVKQAKLTISLPELIPTESKFENEENSNLFLLSILIPIFGVMLLLGLLTALYKKFHRRRSNAPVENIELQQIASTSHATVRFDFKICSIKYNIYKACVKIAVLSSVLFLYFN